MTTPNLPTKSSSKESRNKNLKKLAKTYRLASRKMLQESNETTLTAILQTAAAYSGKDLPAAIAPIFLTLSIQQVCEELAKRE